MAAEVLKRFTNVSWTVYNLEIAKSKIYTTIFCYLFSFISLWNFS